MWLMTPTGKSPTPSSNETGDWWWIAWITKLLPGLLERWKRGRLLCPKCNHLMENETVQAALTERNDTQTSLPLALVIAHRDTQPTTTQQVSLLSFGSESGPVETVQSDESRASKAYLAVDEHFFQAEQEALGMLNIVLQDQEARTFLPIDEELPEQGSMGTGVQQFGMTRFYDLYTVRQLLSFSTLAKEIKQVEDEQVRTILAFALAKLADQNSSLAGWQPSTQHFPNVFGMNAIQMSWDFYELNPFQDTLGAMDGQDPSVGRGLLRRNSGRHREYTIRRCSFSPV